MIERKQDSGFSATPGREGMKKKKTFCHSAVGDDADAAAVVCYSQQMVLWFFWCCSLPAIKKIPSQERRVGAQAT